MVNGKADSGAVDHTILEGNVRLVLHYPLANLEAVAFGPGNAVFKQHMVHRLRTSRPRHYTRGNIGVFFPRFGGIRIIQGNSDRIPHRDIL
ncbi:hypothetical protein D3C85_1646520 [compost metagenome]